MEYREKYPLECVFRENTLAAEKRLNWPMINQALRSGQKQHTSGFPPERLAAYNISSMDSAKVFAWLSKACWRLWSLVRLAAPTIPLMRGWNWLHTDVTYKRGKQNTDTSNVDGRLRMQAPAQVAVSEHTCPNKKRRMVQGKDNH